MSSDTNARGWRLPEPRDITVLGHRIRYWDKGTGTPIVLAHGFSGSALFEWGLVFDKLAETHRVIALQQIGFEPSEHPDIVYSSEAITDHLGAFMRALDLKNITLVGESFGGWVVAGYAARVAEGADLPPIARLIIVAGAVCVKRPVPADARGFADDDLQRDVERFMATQPTNDAARMAILRDSGLARADVTPERLARIAVPTLLLWGDKDEYIAVDSGEEAARLIPNATLTVLPNIGHIPSVEVPDDFVRIVRAFAG